MAPERLLVFELRGSIQSFAGAVRNVTGLELIDEDELEGDGQDKSPTLYLLVPDARALGNIASLWRRWTRGEDLGTGLTPWRDVFATLRDIRLWGPQDRVREDERKLLADEIVLMGDSEKISLEIELVFRANEVLANTAETSLVNAIDSIGGRIVSRCRIDDIGYHAVLAELPAIAVRRIVELDAAGIAGLDAVMHIRPQSIATAIGIGENEASDAQALGPVDRHAILALLDGVPVAQHPLLAGALVVDDQFGLEPLAQVSDRHHGTAMSSLIVHGDRNRQEERLRRLVHLVPVLGANDKFPTDRLIIDMIYLAVLGMRDGAEPSAPEVVIVNLSLGNTRRIFQGQMSAWARLLDRLAYRFGILFVVSAGNHTTPFDIPTVANFGQFQSFTDAERAHATMSALGQSLAARRLLSPAESMNALTVGAVNEDAVSIADRLPNSLSIDPFPRTTTSNPSSALGPGFANSVKPDLLMPGGKEHARFVASGTSLSVKPCGASRAHGLKVAAAPRSGIENTDSFTDGTSAAAALASRACHQIHDALESANGKAFTSLSCAHRATLVKALLVHTASSWPSTTVALIKQVLGPVDNKKHVRQKDNVRRFLGYGVADPELAIACANDRATFWAVGSLSQDQVVEIRVPIPICINGQAKLHSLIATLAWFTPVTAGRRSYRSVRLKLIESDGLSALRVDASKTQPDKDSIARGTVFSKRWEGVRAPAISANQEIVFIVQREPDQGAVIDEPVPFGIAFTFAMPGVVAVYDEVRARLAVTPRVTV
jgi:hypothetical protein